MAKHKEIVENIDAVATQEVEKLSDEHFKYFVEKLGMTEAQTLALPEVVRITMMSDVKTAKADKTKAKVGEKEKISPDSWYPELSAKWNTTTNREKEANVFLWKVRVECFNTIQSVVPTANNPDAFGEIVFDALNQVYGSHLVWKNSYTMYNKTKPENTE